MSEFNTLITDVDRAIARGSALSRTRALARITDLLAEGGSSLGDEQLDVFDRVIGRFAHALDVPGRIGLAERLSDLEWAPGNVVRALAYDSEVAVAEPILARSRQMEDQDLIAVAAEKGSSHMLAICRRSRIAEPVTDILVSLGDRNVHRAVAGNSGARLSEQATTALLETARNDDVLQACLGERRDLTSAASHRLVEIAKETAKRQIIDKLSSPSHGAASPMQPPPPRDFKTGMADVEAITSARPLVERDLKHFANEGRDTSMICAIASLTGMPVPSAEHVFDNRDSELLLLVSKAHKWSWTTLRAMLMLRDREVAKSPRLQQAEARFSAVTAAKARRTLQVLQLRGSFEASATAGATPSLRSA